LLWELQSWGGCGFDVAPDGVHLVGHEPPIHHDDYKILYFLANGKLVRADAAEELIGCRLTVFEDREYWNASHSFDAARGTYTMQYSRHECFVFDLATGTVVGRTASPERKAEWLRSMVFGALGLFGASMMVFAAWGLRRPRSKPEPGTRGARSPL